jgi:peptide/nickel transport system permease protein
VDQHQEVNRLSAAGPLPHESSLARWFDSDVGHSFRTSPVAMVAAAIAFVCVFCAAFANWVAPHNPFDLTTLVLGDARLPPAWIEPRAAQVPAGHRRPGPRHPVGADVRRPHLAGGGHRLGAAVDGDRRGLGLLAGFRGGWVDTFLMRLCDVMLSFPAILVALLIAGVGRALFPNAQHGGLRRADLAITLTGWVQYARTVRGSTMVERNKEYVQAARVTGVPPLRIMLRHVLPNVLGPVLVLATIQVATAIITEATLSFLGVGVPPTRLRWAR